MILRSRQAHDQVAAKVTTISVTKITKVFCSFDLRAFRVLRGFFLVSFVAGACSQAPAPKTYELKGQILGVKPEANELLVKHEDIKGFMPAMTMPYKVSDPTLLHDKQPGDLFTGTLEVSETEGVITAITKTGHAPMDVPPAAPTDGSAQPIEVLAPGQEIPNELFVNQDAKATAFSQFKGHRVALTFIYTRCPMPNFCPLMDRNFVTIQQTIKKAPELSDVRLISVTIDPKFDTPQILKAHAEKLKADAAIWSFMTGDQEVISKFAAHFGLTAVFNEKDPLDITHTLRTAIVGPDGKLVKIHTGNSWTASDLIADLKAIPASGD